MSKVITAAKQVWSAKDQITRNIWLAGLGAYDKGYESASNTMTKSHSIFDELVERGRQLEADTTQTISSQKDKLATASQNATNALQGKVQTAVANITHIDANTFDNIIDKIEQIEIALADAKTEQENVTAPEIEVVQEVIEKVELAVTNKTATVTAEITTAVEKVTEAVTEITTSVIPVIVKPVVTEAVQKVAVVKQHTKKVTNRRVKKNVAKKK
ncbi:MAG: phasin family protein [Moritella sp.]|uniref:phasin-related domain-containing protein n=1 Tax=Moritella sp. TaxID=78556 RepID=UPI0025E88207|nr:phasin family protein [Moritella sp.]NQZ91863.1 phasin family protein [Moritella sp.]